MVLPLILGSSVVSAQDKKSDTTKAPLESVVPLGKAVAAGVDTIDRIVAIVGKSVITWSDVMTAVNQQRAQGLKLPDDPAAQFAIAKQVLNELVDAEILVQRAEELAIEVPDQDVNRAVDGRMAQARAEFEDEIQYRGALREAGFGTPEEFRRSLVDQYRRLMLQQKVFQKLQGTAKPVSVTDKEIDEAFQRARPELQKRAPTITFRNIIITPKPSKLNDSLARAKADSLLIALKKGENFESVAKRESMDPVSKEQGGDLGWVRRGVFVPEFEAAMLSTRPGNLSPVVKTQFGYHIIRVDRVQPGEVKSSHILIAPKIEEADLKKAQALADSVAKLWREGYSYDSLLAKFHDPSEEKAVLEPYLIDSLPESYRYAIGSLEANSVTDPFELQGRGGDVKYAVLQIVTRTGYGEYSLSDVRQTLRRQLSLEKQSRVILDELRNKIYVSVKLD